MDKFCGKCGARLDEITGQCPVCDKKTITNRETKGGAPKREIWRICVIAFFAICVCAVFVLLSRRTLLESGLAPVYESVAATVPPETSRYVAVTEETVITESAMEAGKVPETVQAELSEHPTEETITDDQPETSEADGKLPDFVEDYIQIILDTEGKAQVGGQLHDMNGDGIPELVLLYNILVPEVVTYYDGTKGEESLPYGVCDLYTYNRDEVVQLLDQEIVFSAIGASTSLGAFVDIEGQEYFVLEGYGGPTGVGYSEKCLGLDADSLGDYTVGCIKLFTLDGAKLKCKTDVSYRYHSYAQNSNFSGTMNGKSITENEYWTWYSNLPLIRWFGWWSGASVKDMQIQLKENSWDQAQPFDPIWVPYPVKSVIASSTYTGDNRNHSASNLLDGNPQTNWTEGVKGNGLGEWILFEFKDKYQLNSISICGGCRVDEAHYYDNARPEKATLTFSDGSSIECRLNDNEYLSEQYISFDTPVITDSVKITIDSVYPGEKYEDTVISDVLFGAHTIE